MNHSTKAALAATAALGVAGLASASSVTASLSGYDIRMFDVSITAGPFEGTPGAGTLEFTVDDAGGLPLGTDMVAFCIELGEGNLLNNPGVTFTPFQGEDIANNGLPNPGSAAPELTTSHVAALSWLFDNHFQAAKDGGLDGWAFQLAIWEIVYETESTFSVTQDDGDFWAADPNGNSSGDQVDAIDRANSWFSSASFADITSWDINDDLLLLSNDGVQDIVTLIPLPAPVFMGLAGLAGAIVARRRLRQA